MIETDALATILLDMFEFSPIAMSISTVGYETSRYVKVNPAYLRLIGKSWPEIRDQNLVQAGSAINSPDRARRLRMLDEVGGYTLEEVSIRHANGTIIPTLISARRSSYRGQAMDVEIIIDISDRVRMQTEFERHLMQLALTEPLTGLPNRAHFDRYLTGALRDAPSQAETVALAFLDINGFKPVNDRLGHDVGDALLKVIADRLRSQLRDGDFAARLGGDEFALVFRSPRSRLGDVIDHLRAVLTRVFQPVQVRDHHLEVGVACGVSIQDSPEDTGASLLKAADQQMYLAKASGRAVAVMALVPDRDLRL